jgi:hypothetical protein
MTALRVNFSLPELQERLDQLVEGALFQISLRDYRRLFGASEIAADRLRHLPEGTPA